MRILRVKVDGFGRLRGEYRFPADRLALVVDDNESGKSTLVAALQAGLYGLDDDRRKDRVLTPLERYRPWESGAYRVELELEEGGETYTVKRDFAAGRMEVWNARGQDVTEEFRAGKEEFPVGQKLLGLTAAEFEKCALVRQHDLDGVVPADEKARRGSTLQARLEAAVDTRTGDANASEALGALDQALRHYNCAELETTLKVENAVKQLELKRDAGLTELHALEQEFQAASREALELGDLEEREQTLREAIQRVDSRRKAAMAGEWRRQLEEHERHAAELGQLRAEMESLEHAARLPHNAEGELRETVARYLEAKRNLDSLGTRRAEEREKQRRSAEAELAQVSAFRGLTAEEADRCVALAADLRRLAEEDRRLRDDAFRSRDRIAARGFDPERIQALTQRFGALAAEQQKTLRDQADLALAFQTEVAGLERVRTECSEALRAIDQLRAGRKLPGFVLLALGLFAALGGGLAVALGMTSQLFTYLLIGGLLVAAGGVVLLIQGINARSDERGEALRKLAQAQHRLNLLREQRARSELELDQLADRLRYRDRIELVREWNEYARLLQENEPALKADARLAELREQRQQAQDQARALLARAGGGEPEPAALEQAANAIRRALAAQEKLASLEGDDGSWAEEQRRLSDLVEDLERRAIGIVESVGLRYDKATDWSGHIKQVSERLRDTERHRMLKLELIPRLERRLLSEERVREFKAQLEELGNAPAPAETAGGLELEKEVEQKRVELERVQKQREDLRVALGSRTDRYYQQRPALVENIERASAARDRAQRFKQAVELARETLLAVSRDTHQRWMDFLNERAGKLLAAIGVNLGPLRFGEDLDFSVTLENGQQVVRPRADLHLSAGTRDQLYLAVRVAVSEYLSRGDVRLPLLLDDPLATSDDDRARAAFRLLAEEVSREHQVILMTCHRARFEALKSSDPDLFAQRVQWLDARGAALERAAG